MVITAAGILGADVDPSSGDIRLVLTDKGGKKPHAIRLERGMVSALVATIAGPMRASRKEFRDFTDFQATTLTEARKFSLPDGRWGLLVTLEYSIPLPIVMENRCGEPSNDTFRIEGLDEQKTHI